jgi:hypothetical protein
VPHQNRLIDEAVLSVAGHRWRKVAFVVVETERILEGQLSELDRKPLTTSPEERDAFLDVIAQRVLWLVEAGQLEGAGSLSRWRHSEVRLPDRAQ